MTGKKTKVKDYDQFQLRMPPGMRERIKEKADRAGMSMNEAIVFCLEQFFPAPATFEERVEELAEKVAVLKYGSDLEPQIDEITQMIDKTLREIAQDKLSVTAGFAEKVYKKVEEWEMNEIEEANYRPFDDDQYSNSTYPDEAWRAPFEEPPASGEDPFSLEPDDEKKD